MPRPVAREVAQGFFGGVVVAQKPRPTVGPIGVWPIGFDGDDAEAAPFDEQAGDVGPNPVELLCPVRRFADQDVRRAWIDAVQDPNGRRL
jgi:hypothetical protein